MRISEKIQNINDEIENKLKGYNYKDNIPGLQGNLSIIIGKKEAGKKARTPLLAVFLDNSPIENPSGISEEWNFNLVIISLIVNTDAKTGKEIASDLALEGSTALMEDRCLNGTVRDIVRTNFVPGDERAEVGNNTFGAGVEMQVKFRYQNK